MAGLQLKKTAPLSPRMLGSLYTKECFQGAEAEFEENRPIRIVAAKPKQ